MITVRVVRKHAGNSTHVELAAVHVSDSMGIAFLSPSSDQKVQVHMLRQYRAAGITGGAKTLCRLGVRAAWRSDDLQHAQTSL